MTVSRTSRAVLACALACLVLSAHAQDAIRAELARPLAAARDAVAGKQWDQALQQLAAAEGVGATAPGERYLLERLRAAAAAGKGDEALAARALAAALASGAAPAAEQQPLREALAGAHYRNRDWPAAAAAARAVLAADPANARAATLLVQSLYQGKDFAAAAQALETQATHGTELGVQQLELLASSYEQAKDKAGTLRALERLVAKAPKPAYWADLLTLVESQPGWPQELEIDLQRLGLETGAFTEASDFVELAQAALKAGYPAEAVRALQKGFASKALGSGADAGKHQQLMDQASKLAREDAAQPDVAPPAGNALALFRTGYGLALQGRLEPGEAWMRQALADPALKAPDLARLRLGQALLLAGQAPRALQVFRAVPDQGPTGQLARLWALHAASR